MSSTPAALAKPQPDQPCPCGSGRLFRDCCQPILTGIRPAATAEELMRSRFTAHVVEDFKYLHHTWARTAQTPFVEDQPAPPIAWTGLVVHAHEPGKTPDEAFVDFSAHYVDDDGVPMALHEKSAFARVNGRWLYTRAVREGPAPIKSSTNKVGRNDPCPCGSGRKYKHCCLKTG